MIQPERALGDLLIASETLFVSPGPGRAIQVAA
jgi:hypothetical protein